MKYKYIINSGLAFNEESDMKKLENYARQGWILKSIIGGVLYKFKKSKPQEIIYTVDYQIDVNEEYFNIFKEAGWNHILSIENQIHIFSAKSGTRPIYSDLNSEIQKYINIREKVKKWIFSLLIMAFLFIPLIFIKQIFLIIVGLLIIDICMLTLNIMMYISYNNKINKLKNNEDYTTMLIKNKTLWKINLMLGSLFMYLGMSSLIKKNFLGIFFIIIGIIDLYSALKLFKKDKIN